MYLLMSPTIHSCFDQVVELLMVLVSLRGSVMDDRPRESMQYLVYIKQGTWYLQYLVLIYFYSSELSLALSVAL